MTEYKKYQLLKDIVLPGRIIPEGAIYEEYHTGRSYVNNREPYKPHFISPATIRQYPDWFKGIPPQPSSIDRIEVSTLVGKEKYADPRCTDFIYSFESNSIISPSNFHAIKQAIEQVLNESDTIDIDWSSKPVTEKYYKQSEVDTIREETWKAARETTFSFKGEQDFPNPKIKYPTLQDYLNSLSKETKPKEEDKPVLFTTEDGVDVCSNDVKCYCVYPNDCKIQMVYASRNELSNMDWKRFNVKENAERWLIENKPCLSLNDLLDVWGNADIEPKERTRYKGSPLFQEFEQHAKQKLKQ